MNNQVICHNEFTIVGRITSEIEIIDDCITRVLILCPNDDDYEKLANKVYIDFSVSEYDFFSKMIDHAIAVTGHVEFNNYLRLISDMYKIIY